MYQITDINSNKIIGYTEKILYIKINPKTNIFIETKKPQEADGIAFESKFYQFNPDVEIENSHGVVIVSEIDGGKMLANLNQYITELENAVCDLDILMNGGV